jgi:transcriptional regulator with XRE-family HTH domain
MSIHSRIKERRLALGLKSHQALADLVGVSWQTVQLWEKEGGTAPNRNRIDKVAAALQVTTKWLLHGDNEELERRNHNDANAVTRPVDGPLHTQWVTSQEDYLLTLFRTTDDEGRASIIRTAEAMFRVVNSAVAGNKL